MRRVETQPPTATRGPVVEGLGEADEWTTAAAEGSDATTATSARSFAMNLGIALSLAGVLLVLFAAYLFGYTNLQASRSQRRLVSLYNSIGETPAFAGRTPADGVPVGILSIPALGLSQVVVQGTSAADLENGPGLLPKGAVPGSRGDAVIAGRHSTYGGAFRHISSLHAGDTIKIVDYLGTFTYRVTGASVLGSGQSVSVRPTIRPLLTLITSSSSLPPSGLVVVDAALVGKPLPTAITTPPTTTSELDLGGQFPWQLPLWSAALVGLLGLTVFAYRRARRPGLVYLLSMPVLLPVLLFTFESIARLLPATM